MDLSSLIKLRRELHKRPELSGQEAKTSNSIITLMKQLEPDKIIREIGYHSFAVSFKGAEPGPV